MSNETLDDFLTECDEDAPLRIISDDDGNTYAVCRKCKTKTQINGDEVPDASNILKLLGMSFLIAMSVFLGVMVAAFIAAHIYNHLNGIL